MGDNGVMEMFRVSVRLVYDKSPVGSWIVRLMLCDAFPPVLLAYTVNIVVVMFTVGVPETVPLSKVNPAGKAGWMAQTST